MDSHDEKLPKRNAILTYQEVNEIKVSVARIEETLKLLPGYVAAYTALEGRVRALEIARGSSDGSGHTWLTAVTIFNSVILSLIAVLTYLHHT